MNIRNMSDVALYSLIVSIFLAIVFFLVTFQARMEARTFCKLTGRTDVTWWDALWVELRVSE